MAYTKDFKDYIENLDIEENRRYAEEKFGGEKFEKIGGWCAPQTMMLINNIVIYYTKPEEFYLEIGSYTGKSLVAALHENDAIAHVIEPFDLFLPDGVAIQQAWDKNINEFGVRDRIILHKVKCDLFDESILPKIGFLYYDGNHDAGHTYEGLKKYKKCLADRAIIIVDDYHIVGGPQPCRWPGYPPVEKPVKEDVDRWVEENDDVELLAVTTGCINGQAILIREKKNAVIKT